MLNVDVIVQSYASIEWLCIFTALVKYIDLRHTVKHIKGYLRWLLRLFTVR